MSIDLTIDPEDNIWIDFEQGALSVMGREEQEIHQFGNRLYFGEDSDGYPYHIPFEKLLILSDLRGGDSYEISRNTTLTKKHLGGLMITRQPNPSMSVKAEFSRDEYKTICQYVKAWSEQA